MSKEASQSYSADNWAFWNSDVLEYEQDKKTTQWLLPPGCMCGARNIEEHGDLGWSAIG